MTDLPELDRRRFHLLRWIIASGWIVAMLSAAGVLVTALYCFITKGETPAPLLNMAGTVLGFFLGTFADLVKTLLKE